MVRYSKQRDRATSSWHMVPCAPGRAVGSGCTREGNYQSGPAPDRRKGEKCDSRSKKSRCAGTIVKQRREQCKNCGGAGALQVDDYIYFVCYFHSPLKSKNIEIHPDASRVSKFDTRLQEYGIYPIMSGVAFWPFDIDNREYGQPSFVEQIPRVSVSGSRERRRRRSSASESRRGSVNIQQDVSPLHVQLRGDQMLNEWNPLDDDELDVGDLNVLSDSERQLYSSPQQAPLPLPSQRRSRKRKPKKRRPTTRSMTKPVSAHTRRKTKAAAAAAKQRRRYQALLIKR